MIQQRPEADKFKLQLRHSLQRETLNSRAVRVAKHKNVYSCGDNDDNVYFIESGQIKLLILSSKGKECILAIHTAGDIFGELCLSGLGARVETATAMKETIVKQIPPSQFFARLSRDSLLEGFVRRRSAAGHRKSGYRGQRTAFGPNAIAASAHTGQERSAQHPHRIGDFTRRIVGDGRNNAATNQHVYAKISQSWID